MESWENRNHQGADLNKSEKHLQENPSPDMNSGKNLSGYLKEDSQDRRSEGISIEKRGLKKRKKLTDN